MTLLTAPTHVTRSQAGRILEEYFVHKYLAYLLSEPGGPLEYEYWYGLKMIPVEKLTRYIARIEEERTRETKKKKRGRPRIKSRKKPELD